MAKQLSDKLKKAAYVQSLEQQGINVDSLKRDLLKKNKNVNSERVSK